MNAANQFITSYIANGVYIAGISNWINWNDQHPENVDKLVQHLQATLSPLIEFKVRHPVRPIRFRHTTRKSY
jgi:hypothetical protein